MAFKRIRFKRGSWEEWVEANPVLRVGEPGHVTSGLNAGKVKIGDGVNNFLDLPFLLGGDDGGGGGGGGGGGLTVEEAQDAAAALFVDGVHTGISFTYDDAAARVNAVVDDGGLSGEGLEIAYVNAISSPDTACGRIIWLKAPYSPSNPPFGFLYCNGAAKSRATFAALYSLIGNTYGAGDGTTTFNLPLESALVNPFGDSQFKPYIKRCALIGVDAGTIVAVTGNPQRTFDIGSISASARLSLAGAWPAGWVSMSKDATYLFQAQASDVTSEPVNNRVFLCKINGNNWTRLSFSTNRTDAIGIRRVQISPDSNYLAVAYNNESGTVNIELYRRTGDNFNYVSQYNVVGIVGQINSFAWSPDSSRLAVSDTAVTVSVERRFIVLVRSGDNLAPEALSPLIMLGGNGQTPNVAWHPDGFWLVTLSASQTGQVVVASFGLSNGSLFTAGTQATIALSYSGSGALSFNEQGTHLVANSDNFISAAEAANVFKFEAGSLKRIVFNNANGNAVNNAGSTALWVPGTNRFLVGGQSYFQLDPGGDSFSRVPGSGGLTTLPAGQAAIGKVP